ncbi:LPS-assembly lipoprotein LptE [Pelagibaculum spongiae]|nr:LPS assembly lipoprotein LptE [Pelagibaculum spongiae]
MLKSLKLISFLLLSLSLSACGFHLRGSQAFQPLEMRIDGEYSQLYRYLTEDLKPSASAALQLTIIDEKWIDRSLSYDTSNNVTEYELVYRVQYTLGVATPEGPLRKKTMELMRVYQADTANPLANRAEQRLLVDDMTRRAAKKLLARAKAAK